MENNINFGMGLYNYGNVEIISNISDVSMENEWYDIAVESHFWFEWRLRAMLKQVNQLKIPINKKLRVLEVGCGMGTLRRSIESNTSGMLLLLI